jgi:hypothetical protein
MQAQTAPTGYVSDANIPAVAATTPSQNYTYLLNRDESVSYLQVGQIVLAGCPPLDQSQFVPGSGYEQNLIYDATANRVYIMSPLADNDAGILYETPDPAGNCKPSPVVDLSGFLNYSETMASDPAENNLYVVDSHNGGNLDELFVLNTSSFATYSGSNATAPPSYNLDYGANYAVLALDPSSHLVYLPETNSGGGSAGPGFFVFDPTTNKLQHVLGYIDPTTSAQVNITDLAVLVAGNGKIVIVNSNPNASSAFESQPLIELDTTQFSFFSNTITGSGFPSGVYIEPKASAITLFSANTQYSNISAADIDSVHGVVYVSAIDQNGSSQTLPQGLLLSYNLATQTETVLNSAVPEPTTYSSTTYSGWAQLTWDSYANEVLLFSAYAGSGTMAISSPVSSTGVSLAVITATSFNPIGLVFNPNSGFIYAPSVVTPGTPSDPTVYYFGPAPHDALALQVPATGVSGVAFNVQVTLESNGTGTPPGNIAILASENGGTANQVATVSAATALAAGATGTPVSVTLDTAGSWVLSATYTGNASFPSATSGNYSIQIAQVEPTVATPAFSPGAGSYTAPVTVTISDATAGATISYTTNGTAPGTSSTSCAAPCTVTLNAGATVEAEGVLAGDHTSSVATAIYTLTLPAPVFSPAAGSVVAGSSVTISDADTSVPVTMYYTTNGTTPTASSSSTSCTAPCSVTLSSTAGGTETVEAIATGTGLQNSAVTSATYTLTAAPSFTFALVTGGTTEAPGSGSATNGNAIPVTFTLTLTALNGFNTPVTLGSTLGTAPEGTTQPSGECVDGAGLETSCTYTPSAQGTTVYYMFYYPPPTTSAAPANGAPRRTGLATGGLVLSFSGLLLGAFVRNRRRFTQAITCVALLGMISSLGVLVGACGSGGGARKRTIPPGTQATITATPQGSSSGHSVTVYLTYTSN